MDSQDKNAEIEKIAERIVREDVFCNVDSLVRYSIEKSFEDTNAPIGYDDLLDSGPDFDSMNEDEIVDYLKDELGYNDSDIADMDDPWEAARDEYEPGEVFEYWAVSGWLYNHLKERGEIVINAYPHIWGRQTTGQAITMDWAIRRIAEYIYNL